MKHIKSISQYNKNIQDNFKSNADIDWDKNLHLEVLLKEESKPFY